jgi:hypothetical protein
LKQTISILVFIAVFVAGFSQSGDMDKRTFFTHDAIVQLYLTTHFKQISNPKFKEVKRPAHARMVLPDGRDMQGNIELRGRGDYRFMICSPPPLMLYFKTPGAGSLKGLGKLKMVWSCKDGDYYDQLLMKEYLIYRMYNLITPYSFRVRQLEVFYRDSSRLDKWTKKQGFLMEDIDDLAKRLYCKEREDTVTFSREINDSNYAVMALFQYMIGNTDWSIANYQNIKLIAPDNDTRDCPFAIPYDFDHAGLVNAEYAAPHEKLPIENVQQRYNTAMPLAAKHLERAITIFKARKDEIFFLIESFEGLKPGVKKEMTLYIDEFYRILNDAKKIDNIFIKEPATKNL